MPACSQTRDNAAGYAEAAQHLRECAAIRFGAKLTLFGNKVKLFTAAVPREADGVQHPGAGLRLHAASGGSDVSMSELRAVLSYHGPSGATYVIAFVRLLQCVPARVCVVRGACDFAVGDQVTLLTSESRERGAVRARKLGSRAAAIRIESEVLAPVTDEKGVHHVIKYAGPYVQYSHNPAQDCSDPGYDTANEIHAISTQRPQSRPVSCSFQTRAATILFVGGAFGGIARFFITKHKKIEC